MILAGTKKFIAAAFDSEQELERVVQINAEYIFGPDSIYLPKSLVRTSDGFGTIPDGFVVDLASRTWFIVEAELAVHSVWITLHLKLRSRSLLLRSLPAGACLQGFIPTT